MKMQDDLPKSETVDHHDVDEWRYSRTADRHNVYIRLYIHELLRTVHDQLVSQIRYFNLLFLFRPSFFLTQ